MGVDWQQVKEVFAAALECPPDRRRALLDDACRGDSELRREIETLLESHDAAGRFLIEPVLGRHDADASDQSTAATSDRRIGPYRVLRPLGRGGMGVVYLALRDDDAYRKQVAIKLIQHGLDRDAIVRRFRTERQILATLEHPSIARLLDGGQTDDGLPYLVMEYVDGERIDQWADRRSLDLRHRLELFRTVCGAVQAAHQSLVIHRDLKPSNILVTSEGTPKLLDFGIAKLLDQDLTAETVVATVAGEWLMTPQYASPEQLRGQNITTASDVYALGLLLYELISGCRAYTLDGSAPTAMMDAICRQIPESPGTRFAALDAQQQAELAQQRASDPRRLRRALAGDLDKIVAKALRKEAGRRYASADQLSDDIGRHLEGLPIRARPDTPLYLVSKFVQRNRALSLAMATLVVLAATMTWQGFELRRERDISKLQLETAEAVALHMIDQVKNWDPSQAQGEEPTISEVLQRGARTLEDLTDRPSIYAQLQNAYGEIFMNRGSYELAETHLMQALDSPLELGDEKLIADSRNDLAVLRSRQGRTAEAIELMRQAAESYRRVFGEEHETVALVLANLGGLHYQAGELEAAEPLMREALELQRRLHGEKHPQVVTGLANLGRLRVLRGDLEEAELLLRQALELGTEVEGEDHPRTLANLNSLAVVLRRSGSHEAAVDTYRRALEARQRVLGTDHPDVATTMSNLAQALRDADQQEAAEGYLREALDLRRRVLGPDHPKVAVSLNTLAKFLLDLDQAEAAAELYRQALELRRRLLPADHPDLAGPLIGLARTELRRERPATALELLREAVAIRRQALGDEHWRTASAESLLGLALMRLGDDSAARPLLEHGYAVLLRELGDQRAETRRAAAALAELGAPAQTTASR